MTCKCPVCQSEFETDSKAPSAFCIYCGSPLHPDPHTSKQAAPEEQKLFFLANP